MAARDRQGGDSKAGPGDAAEPITLTDPDGAVTRMAPSSSWTREQVRAPGGEPALVTRLDSGQLWFAAGRRRSPWRHEVHVGAAIVTTPQGRFQAIAEPDGGATVVCLAGRTRVVAGPRDPVVLTPEQSAAISVDGATLVVMGRSKPAVPADASASAPELAAVTSHDEGPDDAEADVIDLTDTAHLGAAGPPAAPSAEKIGKVEESTALVALASPAARRSRHWEWLAEVIAVAAVVALLVALAVTFSRSDPGDDVANPAATTDVTDKRPTATVAATTTTPVTTTATSVRSATTTATTTTVTPTTTAPAPTTTPRATTAPPAATSGSSAAGQLVGCRRSGDAIRATVDVTHRSGIASHFKVTVGLVDRADNVVSRADARTDLLAPGGRTTIDVTIPSARGGATACELLGVVPA